MHSSGPFLPSGEGCLHLPKYHSGPFYNYNPLKILATFQTLGGNISCCPCLPFQLLILYPWLTSLNPVYTFVNKPFIKIPFIIPSECVISFLFDSICVLLYVNMHNIYKILTATPDPYLLALIHSTLYCVLRPVHIHGKSSIVL